MGKWVIPLEELGNKRREGKREVCGSKAAALGIMLNAGLNVPSGLCIGTQAYEEYVEQTGIRGRILLELSRKPFEERRWEELWDLSEKIKHMFFRTPLPHPLKKELGMVLAGRFEGRAVAVRSSAPGEDSAKASFAGVHESYVNVRGLQEILRHLRLVWASLWSDTALLYRKEMGLDVFKSAMAVLVQEIVEGRVSGVAFGMNPENESEAVVEAVYGLNKGLVDGLVEPDRWILERDTGALKHHHPALREKEVVGKEESTELRLLSPEMKSRPPLTPEEVLEVYSLVQKTEKLFYAPQDVEWTWQDKVLYALQSRPITTLTGQDRDEKRLWYLSLRRSFENLIELREVIEGKYIPAMQAEASTLKNMDLSKLSDPELADEIERRGKVFRKWHDIYWDSFIPFAHGVRLFGQVYNEKVSPEDPYEFVDLLSGTGLLSLERNQKLEGLASRLRKSPALRAALEKKGFGELETDEGQEFVHDVDIFLSKFGGSYSESPTARAGLFKLLLELASCSPDSSADTKKVPDRTSLLKEDFISRFDPGQKQFAADLLDLARASYRLRDDDNLHLGKIEAELHKSLLKGRESLLKRGFRKTSLPEIEPINGPKFIEEMVKALRRSSHQPLWPEVPILDSGTLQEKRPAQNPRQLLGNPSGPGAAEGYARVILKESDLFEVRAGEVLVCDAIDPNMTFIVPLCAAIVERRGGMLIHGAIIAREYGIPCVTGVPDASKLIKNGDYLVVDGYLGIVTVLKRRDERFPSNPTNQD